jgi:hypothetical protein
MADTEGTIILGTDSRTQAGVTDLSLETAP